MSNSEHRREVKRVRALCAACRARKALFKYRGDVRADRDHTLCFECYRAQVNRARARRLSESQALSTSSAYAHGHGASGGSLSRAQIGHRQRMLDHLRRPGT